MMVVIKDMNDQYVPVDSTTLLDSLEQQEFVFFNIMDINTVQYLASKFAKLKNYNNEKVTMQDIEDLFSLLEKKQV